MVLIASYSTVSLVVTGNTPRDYSIAIPATPGKTFSNLIMDLRERIAPVQITDIEVVSSKAALPELALLTPTAGFKARDVTTRLFIKGARS